MIHVWVRTDVPWHDEAAFAAQLPPELRPLVELWNATFALPYHRFRAEVREVARANLAAVEGATVSAWEAIPEGALVLPVDDDDWFAPHTARTLAREHAGEELVRWPSVFLEVDIDRAHTLSKLGRRVLPGVGPKHVCTTNNYAVVKRPGARPLCASHLAASRRAGEHRGGVGRLDERLSVMNRTLASQTTLLRHRSPIDRRGLLRKRARYAALYDRWPRRGGDLAWARPYVERMRALMEALG